jgi:hypothetical protein
MGLISICPARRFLEGAKWEHVQAETDILLASFFEAMAAKSIYLQSGIAPRIASLAEAETGISLSAFYGEAVAQAEVPETNIFPPKVASGECSIRMTQIPQLPKASAGISFGLDEEPNSPRTRWSVVLHRGPLPLLEIGISDEKGFRLPGGWPATLVSGGAAHVVWISGNRYLGAADQVYLWLKREKLFPYSKGDSGEEAITAGQRLRQLCQNAWAQYGGEKTEPYELSSWHWSQKRFVRNFDKVLLSRVGSRELSKTLKPMGTNVDQWLQACE